MFSVVPLLLSVITASAADSKSAIAVDLCKLDEFYVNSYGNCDLTITNSGGKPIRLSEFVALKGMGNVDPPVIEIQPHAKAYAKLKVKAIDEAGLVRFPFSFKSSEPGFENSGVVNAYGYVLSALDDPRPEVDFGPVNVETIERQQKVLALGSHDTASFKVLKVLAKPSYISASILPDGKHVRFGLLPGAPWGVHVDTVRVAIDTPNQKEAWIKVKSDIHGDVVPDSNPFALGLMRAGNQNEQLVRLSSRSGKDFEIGEVKLEGVKGRTEVLPCLPAAAGCRLIKVRVSDEQPKGVVHGTLKVELPKLGGTLPIALWGMMVSKTTKVVDLNEKLAEDAGKSVTTGRASSVDHLDLGLVLKEAVSPKSMAAPEAAPKGRGPLLKWKIENGAPVYGFQIFRSESQDGTFVRVNGETILSTTQEALPTSYQWRDESAKPGTTYWYYIGVLDKNGTKRPLSKPQRVIAK